MKLNKLRLFSLVLLAAVGSTPWADVVQPGKPDTCNQMAIKDPQEIKKMMDLLVQTPAKIETDDDGGKKVVFATKEMNLGNSTHIRCTQITQDGVNVSYFRGARPGCTIVQGPNPSSTGGPTSTPSTATGVPPGTAGR